MKTLKLFISFLSVSILSAFVAIGTYSYLNKNQSAVQSTINGGTVFNQAGFKLASYAEAAENTDFTLAAEQSVNAVVHIKSIVKPSQNNRGRQMLDPFEFFFGNPFGSNSSPRQRVGFGSGVIISNDGYIITNNHVIEGADEIEVTTNDDKTFKAKLTGTDAATDIALLKVDGKELHVLPFGDSDNLKVGQWVLAVGNPLNLTSTVTAGIVSAVSRSDLLTGYNRYRNSMPQDKIESYIQTDAAVNPGNSGGALVNTRGELVGINAALVSETGSYIGYSFAIPINIVKKVVSDIKEYGIVQRAVLGIETRDLSMKNTDEEGYADIYEKLKETEGIYVKNFSSQNSPSKKAGINIGDIITSINGIKTKSLGELKAQLRRYSPGDKVEVQVKRDKDTKKFTVELKNEQGTTDVVKYRSPSDILGASFKELSHETKMRLGVNFGVEVTNLKSGKLKEAGIKEGFIILSANDKRISSENDLLQITEALQKEAPDERGLFLKGLYPGERRVQYIAIDLTVYE
ncbi:MAG: trypsin-like peptidase domain-containing protein [Dysgonamonadaceae bacterium]|jgi:Do/DeqQ family serine protease|nr:trypsin-like peptidase domain-containing protein [Dysgonamonadaceae bacterium]